MPYTVTTGAPRRRNTALYVANAAGQAVRGAYKVATSDTGRKYIKKAMTSKPKTAGTRMAPSSTSNSKKKAPPLRMSKVDKMNSKKLVMQYRFANEYEATTGGHIMTLNSENGARPFHCYCLTNIIQSNRVHQGLQYYDENTASFPYIGPSFERVLMESGVNNANIKDMYHKSIMTSFSVKLLLHGLPRRDMKYTVMLFQPTSTLDPAVPNPVDELYDARRQNTIDAMGKLILPAVQNPVCQRVAPTKKLARGMKVLWKKDFVLGEQLTTEDQIQKKLVSINRVLNKALNFAYQSNNDNLTAGLEGDHLLATDANKTTTAEAVETLPQRSQRIYLGILAHETRDSSSTNNERAGYTSPTYDIDIVVRHLVAA